MMDAIQQEMRGLIERGTFNVIHRRDVYKLYKRRTIVDGRFVLAVKNAHLDNETAQARFLVQWHTDIERELLVHNSTNLQKSFIRIVKFIAAIVRFRI